MTASNADRRLPPRGSALFRPRKLTVRGSFTHEELVADLAAQVRARQVMAEGTARDLAFPPHRRPARTCVQVDVRQVRVDAGGA